jgi:hypothetical protein
LSEAELDSGLVPEVALVVVTRGEGTPEAR